MGIDISLVSMVLRFDVTTIMTLVAPTAGYVVPNPLMTTVVIPQLET